MEHKTIKFNSSNHNRLTQLKYILQLKTSQLQTMDSVLSYLLDCSEKDHPELYQKESEKNGINTQNHEERHNSPPKHLCSGSRKTPDLQIDSLTE